NSCVSEVGAAAGASCCAAGVGAGLGVTYRSRNGLALCGGGGAREGSRRASAARADKKGRGVSRTGSAVRGGGAEEAAGTGGGEGARSDPMAFSKRQRSRDKRASLAWAIS